jgi:hypothetical protein
MSPEARKARAEAMGFDTSKVWYHTTDREFDRFKRRLSDVGIHFGTAGQAEDRMSYLTSGGRDGRSLEGSRTIPVYLRVRNPLRLSDAGLWRADNLVFELERAGFDKAEINAAMRSSRNPNGQLSALRDLIKRKGYDGIVYQNTGEVSGAAALQAAQDEAWRVVKASQKARNKPLNSFDAEDQATPEYQAYNAAYLAQKAFREENAEDSIIILDADQARSVNAAFAEDSTPVLLASFSSSNTDGQSQRAEFDALGFSSKALEAAKAWKQKTGTPQQVLRHLETSGVKKNEIEATGLDKFLAVPAEEAVLAGLPKNRRSEIIELLQACRA